MLKLLDRWYGLSSLYSCGLLFSCCLVPGWASSVEYQYQKAAGAIGIPLATAWAMGEKMERGRDKDTQYERDNDIHLIILIPACCSILLLC